MQFPLTLSPSKSNNSKSPQTLGAKISTWRTEIDVTEFVSILFFKANYNLSTSTRLIEPDYRLVAITLTRSYFRTPPKLAKNSPALRITKWRSKEPYPRHEYLCLPEVKPRTQFTRDYYKRQNEKDDKESAFEETSKRRDMK